ncbi:PAAR domain-containing protein [Metapseudomonas otitidis]|uniref:PAAR domain-containing protein n=1 Tax=Metapseudomonas otitidis TaxID=319939 RepID=UPI001F0DB917|nr:PAAR domain-containing protein [Pseudomonas otitidis]
MSGKPAARVGDPAACPMPGHGVNPIVSGSPDVLFDGMSAARQTDSTACGGALVGNVIPNVLINGLPATTVGTVGSHGNIVIGGSGTVIIGMTGGGAAFTPSVINTPTLCLPCLLLAAKRNAAFVPLAKLGAAP